MKLHYFGILTVVLVIFMISWDYKEKCLMLYDLSKRQQNLVAETLQDKKLMKDEAAITARHDQLKKTLSPYFLTDNSSDLTAQLLSKLNHAARVNGIDIQDIQPIVWKPESYFTTFLLQCRASGDFNGFLQWLLMLGRFPMPLSLNNVTLVVDKKNRIQIAVSLTGHYFPLKKETRHASGKIQSRQQDVFHSGTRSVRLLSNVPEEASDILHSVSFKHIKWVGYMRYGVQYWAMAKLPSGKTIPLSVGDRAGIERAKVMKADEEKIILFYAGKETQYRYA